MPIEYTPPRRLIDAFLRLRARQRQTGMRTDPHLTEEVIEASNHDGTYKIKGKNVSQAGTAQLRAGEVVVVAWKDSNTPTAILAHSARRIQPVAVLVPPGGGIVEELFLANGTDGQLDIWFRNDIILSNLHLRGQLVGPPEQVRWGARGDSFFVRVGNLYYTFTFSRLNGIDAPLHAAPKPKLLRPAEAPWTGETIFMTVSQMASVSMRTLCVFQDAVTTATDIFVYTGTQVGGVVDTLSRSDTPSKSEDIRLTAAAVTNGDIVIVDAELDWEYSLIVTLRVKVFNLVSRITTSTLTKVAVKGFYHFHSPYLDTMFGDPTALSLQCGLDGIAVGQVTAAPPDGDIHAIVVNVTKSIIIWRSTPAMSTVTSEIESTDGVGRSQRTTNNVLVPGEPPDPPLPPKSGLEEIGDHNFMPLPGYYPTFSMPPSDVDAELVSAPGVMIKNTGSRNLLDQVGLAFLTSPVSLDKIDVTSIVTRYSHLAFAAVGTVSSSGNVLHGMFLQAAITSTITGRPALLFLTPLHYLPRRTTSGGDVFLFAELREQDALAETFIAQHTSFWKYSTDTRKAFLIQAWDRSTLLRTYTMTVIGVSLRHILWMKKSTGSADVRYTIFLIDMTLDPSAPLRTKTLFDVTTSSFIDVPPAISTFIARSWELMRPDVLYLLDDPDKQVTNKFLLGWSQNAVTFDPVKLVLDPILAHAGNLKKLPDGIVPEHTGSKIPSVRVLESPQALQSRFISDP